MSFATLDVRGPCKISDIDIAVDGLTEDGMFDLTNDEAKEFYETLNSLDLGLEMDDFFGPGGGHPNVTLYGTKENLSLYFEKHYTVGCEELLASYTGSIEKV